MSKANPFLPNEVNDKELATAMRVLARSLDVHDGNRPNEPHPVRSVVLRRALDMLSERLKAHAEKMAEVNIWAQLSVLVTYEATFTELATACAADVVRSYLSRDLRIAADIVQPCE